MKLLNKIFSFISVLLLLFYQVSLPILVLAQESINESSQSGEVESSIPSQPALSESLTNLEASDSALIDTGTTESQNSASLAPPTNVVTLNTTYKAPQNNKVTVTFTKLPDSPGTLTIKEITLTDEQVKQTGALSSIAYDISSTMQDGTFEYTLTLPTSTTENVEVKASEDGQVFNTLGGVSPGSDILTITGLTHFTIFVVAGTIDSENNVALFNESGASVVINEFVFDSSTEWVELFNRSNGAVDLSGWRLEDANSLTSDDLNLSGIIPPGGIFVFQRSSGWLNNDGDAIRLKDNESNIVDRVSYKDEPEGGVVEAEDVGGVSKDESVGRTTDGQLEGDSHWSAFSSPTKGYNNSGDLTFINVGDNFPDFTSIQDGIDAVSEGGTVNVASGDYTETIYIDRGLTLTGAGRENTTVFDNDCNGDPTVSIDADNVTIQDFTINNDGCKGSVVWVGDERNGTIIQGNKLINGYYGIELRSGSSDIQILENTISDSERSGIYSGNSSISNITTTGNDIQNNSEAGIYHDQVTGTITVSGNTLSNNSSYGMYLGTVLNATVTIGGDGEEDRNTITDNDSTGIYLSGGGNSISGSTVTLSGNTISTNNGDGIYADVITDSTFSLTNNTIETNNNGIYICAQGECVNSTVTIDGNGINDNNGAGIYLYEILDGSTMTITQNSIQGNGEESFATGIYINYVYNSTLDISANDILENIGDGIHIVRIEEGGEGGETLVTIPDNNVTGNQGYGVYMSEVSNSDVTIGEGNTISNNNNAGIYLNSQVQGVGISGNTITGNGEVAETTGIVVLSASGNEVHENNISGNGSTGVQNNDGTNDFDANENYWGADSGPLHETTNPEGQGNAVSDNVMYRPFYTDEGRTTLSTNSVDPDDLSSLLDSGSFDIPDGENSESASQITVNEDLTINVSDSGGTSSVVLPSGTVITNEDGTINVPDLTSDDVTESSLSGLGTGVVIDGALQWGLDDIELTFSQPITLNIFVGTALNGQTLSVVRSTSGSSGWTSDGIVAPATCIVTAGICSFQATKASYFAATSTSSPAPSSATQALSQASGPVAAPTCNDTKPGSAPTLLSTTPTGPNQVTLTWSKAANPVTYYLATYGDGPGLQQYGNPNIGGPDTTSYTVSGLAGGTTYYFRVRAGNGCAPGDFSNELSASPSGGFIAGPAAGFEAGVLGVSDADQGNAGVGEESGQVQGETTTTSPQPTATTQPPATQQSSFNVKVVAIVAAILLVGFGLFRLVMK